MDFLIILGIGFAFMWLLIVLPQRRRQSAHARMLAGIGPGDEIVTAGGLYGTVRGIDDEAVTLEVAPGIEVRVARGAVAGRRDEETAAKAVADDSGGEIRS